MFSKVNAMRSLAICILFLILVPARAAPFYVSDAQRLAGTWKLVSIVYEDANTGERLASQSENTKGYQIATPDGWWMTLITNEPPRAATGGDVGAAAPGPVIAFAGRYRLERGNVLIKVVAGRVSGVIGTDLLAPYRFDTDRLRMALPQNLFTTTGARSTRAIATWEKEN